MKKIYDRLRLLLLGGLVSLNSLLWRFRQRFKPYQVAALNDDLRTAFKTFLGVILVGFVIGNNNHLLLAGGLAFGLVCYVYALTKVPKPKRRRRFRRRRSARNALHDWKSRQRL